jgi:hypothetical protein
LQADLQKGAEELRFASETSGLFVADTGPASVDLNHAILKYPNGTVYTFGVAAVIPAGGKEPMAALIPPGICSPGASSCLSRYKAIISGNSTGSSVGVVTSAGNTFWYTYSLNRISWNSLTAFPRACPAGESVSQINTTLSCSSSRITSARVKSSVTTSEADVYISTSLSVLLSANTSYVFYAFTAIEPSFGIESYNFEVHQLPAGALLVIACSPMSYPLGGGNQPTNCVSSTGTPIAATDALGFGVSPPVYATPGLFGMVSMGATAGTLQIDFACTSHCGNVTLKAGSFILVESVA